MLHIFQKSNFSTYQRMWTFMKQTQPDVFTSSNGEGVDRVLKGKGLYAFLMESVSIEYQTNRNCGLMQVGGTLDSKGYGIGMPMGNHAHISIFFSFITIPHFIFTDSPYRTLISSEVLNLQERGSLQALKDKWWGTPKRCAVIFFFFQNLIKI